MPRRFDDHLMSTNAIHLIINPFAFSVQLSLYSECREFIGNDAEGPTRGVRKGSIVSKCDNLWGSSIFIAFTEGTESTY
jgi:hypothetical protein